METFRIEAGWPRYGRDLTEDNLPQEVGRDRLAISFTKGCYLGQETVARIDSRGHVNRLLTGLVFASPQVAEKWGGTPRRHCRGGGGHVGRILPGPQTAVALGYVRRGHNEPGELLGVGRRRGYRGLAADAMSDKLAHGGHRRVDIAGRVEGSQAETDGAAPGGRSQGPVH